MVISLKKVSLQLSDDMHTALKAYAAFSGKTMGEILNDWIEMNLQSISCNCAITGDIFDRLNIPRDKRVHKECMGYKCYSCEHQHKCRLGMYDGEFEVCTKCIPYLQANSSG